MESATKFDPLIPNPIFAELLECPEYVWFTLRQDEWRRELLRTGIRGKSGQFIHFPLAGEKEGWAKLAKNLKAEIDEDLIEAYRGTESLPVTPGKNKRVAVKIVDDRGIESLRIINLMDDKESDAPHKAGKL